MLGSRDLQPLADKLQISGTKEKQIVFTPDGTKYIPKAAKLCVAIYKKYGTVWEMTDFSMGKDAVTIKVPESSIWKMTVMLTYGFGGKPLYEKAQYDYKK